MQETKSIQQFFINSAGGFRIIGKKKKLLTEKLISIYDAEGIEKLILFLQIIQQLNSKKEMQPLSEPIIQRNIKTFDGNRLNKIIEFTFREFQRVITLDEVAALANRLGIVSSPKKRRD